MLCAYYQSLLGEQCLDVIHTWLLSQPAVTEERQKREELEKELKKLADLARQLIKHYDNCFVGLARQVRESPW